MQAGLVRSVAQNKDTLDKAQQAFEKDFIVELETTDRRLNDAKSVLDNHIVVSPIFAALAQSTLKSIQFTKFSYATTGTGPSAKVAVSMSGKAASYTSIALESDLLTQNKYITDPIFANLTLDDQSNVLFDLTFNVDPHFVSFGESLAQQLPATADTAGQGSAAPSPAAASSAPSDGTQAPSTSTTNQAAQ